MDMLTVDNSNQQCKMNVTLLDKAFFVYLILYAGGSLDFFHTIGGNLTLLFGICLLFFFHHLHFSRNLLICLAVWFVYFICSSFAIGSFHPYFMIEIPIAIFCAYVVIQTFRDKIIETFIWTVFSLALISLPLYALQLLLPQTVLSVLSYLSIQGTQSFSGVSRITGSIVFYAYNIGETDATMRNCGFCWEPGAFSCFCLVALFLNYFFIEKKTKMVYIILLLALVTTFSTTGYAILSMLVGTTLLSSKKIYSKLLLIPTCLLILYVATNYDFMWEKVSEQLYTMESWEQNIEYSITHGKHYTLGRFSSLSLALENFKLRPILGYGGNTTLEYSAQLGAGIAIISGIGVLMARYGLFGLITWLYLLYCSGSYWNKFRRNGTAHFLVPWFILHIGVAISYNFLFSAVFFAFTFYPLFCQSQDISHKLNDTHDSNL